MAGLASILNYLGRAVWRDVRKFEALATNQFFLFALFFVPSGGFLPALIGLLLLFPLSEDPLRKIPPDRLAIWPLGGRSRTLLRIASMWLSPLVWVTLGVLLFYSRAWLTLQFAVLGLAIHFLELALVELPSRMPAANLLRYVPAIPGQAGELVRKSVRSMLCVLDFYCAAALALAGGIWRAANGGDDAALGMTVLVLLALSTCAQSLFGLDGMAGLVRYRLLPLRGWRILAAQGSGFFLAALILTLPLDPMAGVAGALMGLAVGHHSSVLRPRPQQRWRFSGGTSIFSGLIQVVLMLSAAVATHREGAWLAGACAVPYAASLAIYGRRFEGRDAA